MTSYSDCVFCRIINREIPSDIIFEDEQLLAIADIDPAAPVHLLIIPRDHISSLNGVDIANQNLLGHIQIISARLAQEKGVAVSGYRLVCNNGNDGGQTVLHLHYHLLGGRELRWPPG
ncbi:MAG: histidine triad nucleotide-binding protein [Syntrophomonadaceae bacterium]|jgi:histidine triad (HIT) family protein|nr:histidine triad nucleotide-binding protein [Syntrophomonadaceae bacterium]